MAATLQHNFAASAARRPHAVAVVEPGLGTVSYGELDVLSVRMRDRLSALGVGRGDRVGLFMKKSADSLAAILGILKVGAAYVPVDAGAPVARGAYILNNCAVKAVAIDAAHASRLSDELATLGATPYTIVVGGGGAPGAGLRAALDKAQLVEPAAPADTQASASSDLAYILYTSGSTGRPKGVMLSQENALSFEIGRAHV